MKWAVFILFFAALLADVYIYRSLICNCFRRLPARVAYIVYAVVSDGAALAAFFLYGYAASRGPAAVITVMWIVWVFLLSALPKLLFMAGGFFDHIVSLISHRRVLVFRPVAVVLAFAGIIIMIYGATKGRTGIKINEVEICSDRIPGAFDGYRIVQFSDLHIGSMPNAVKRMRLIADEVNGLGPDMVLNTGDLVHINQADLTAGVMAELSRIKARDGVWSVWGNHDLGFYVKDTLALPLRENLAKLSAKVDGMGWNELTDRSVYVHRDADSILVTGVNYPEDRTLNGHNHTLCGADIDGAFDGVSKEPFSIVLSHAPQLWREIAATGFGDLVLAGHIHSMQFKFRIFKRSWSPARCFHPEWSGLYVENKGKKSSLYINDGIGCAGCHMRIGAAPELTLFILRRCE